MAKITVNSTEITIVKDGEQDYICLTDMVKDNGGNTVVQNWIRNKNTLEFLGVWEKLYNPNFNSVEFHRIMHDAGVERFIISPKQWIEKTNAIGITAKTGKYGGTYAHKDIAFEFGSWLSPEFKLLLIKEFQRLKDQEQQRLNSGWDVRRFVSKANYKIQTDAIAEKIIPNRGLAKDKEFIVYAEEADLLNMAVFGQTAKQWRDSNPALASKGLNIRDVADVYQLIVISNLESINGALIRGGEMKRVRFEALCTLAKDQLKSLNNSTAAGVLNAQSPHVQLKAANEENAGFGRTLKAIMKVPPPKKNE
jgi:hypothetical protein